MAKLILSLDGVLQSEIALSKERTTIGRKAENDIQIDNLAVSGEHAVIVRIAEDYFLEDLGSTNGTLINGTPVKRQLLKNGDAIELGKYKLVFAGHVRPTVGANADYEKTMIWRPGALKKAIQEEQPPSSAPIVAPPASVKATPAAPPAAVQTAAAAQPPSAKATAAAPSARVNTTTAAPPPLAVAPSTVLPRGALRILEGVDAGKELDLAKRETRLGKAGQQVALLTRRPAGYFITHVEGATHPQVNGRTIGNAPYALEDHDIIELKGVKVEFLRVRSDEAPVARQFWKYGLLLIGVLVVGFLVWRMRG